MTAILLIVAGFVLAALGGEAFVRGSVGLALRFRIPTAVIGLTIAAFATSSPELSVAVNAALAGKPEIALGDGLGSSVINISLVLALALCFGGLPAKQNEVGRDWVFAMLSPVILFFFSFDGVISRQEGMILMLIFAVWLAWVLNDTRKRRADIVVPEIRENVMKVTVYCVVGVALLVGAGLAIVAGAKLVGVMFGISPFVIGATLVALGTSMPELATTVIARMRGHHDMGLATILGSNIFNVFVIIAIAAMIHPIQVDPGTLWVVLGTSVIATLLTWPTKTKGIPRWRGFVLLGLYVCYIAITLKTGGSE